MLQAGIDQAKKDEEGRAMRAQKEREEREAKEAQARMDAELREIGGGGAGPAVSIASGPDITAAAAALPGKPDPSRKPCDNALDKWRSLNRETGVGNVLSDAVGRSYPAVVAMARYDHAWWRSFGDRSCEDFMDRTLKTWTDIYESACAGSRSTTDERCQVPPGFDAWFQKRNRNAAIAAAWARGGGSPGAPSASAGGSAGDGACAAEMNRITATKRSAEGRVDPRSVVQTSELEMWYFQKMMDAILRLCPNSPKYRREYDQMKATIPQLQRACDQMSSSPPCVARLPR